MGIPGGRPASITQRRWAGVRSRCSCLRSRSCVGCAQATSRTPEKWWPGREEAKVLTRLPWLCREHLGACTVSEWSLPAALLPLWLGPPGSAAGGFPPHALPWWAHFSSLTEPSTCPSNGLPTNPSAIGLHTQRSLTGQPGGTSLRLSQSYRAPSVNRGEERSEHLATGTEVEGEAAAIQTPYLTPPDLG